MPAIASPAERRRRRRVWKVSPPAYVDLCARGDTRPLASYVLSLEPAEASAAPVLSLALAALLLAGCGSTRHRASTSSSTSNVHDRAVAPDAGHGSAARHGVVNVYSADAAGDLSPVVRGDPALVYVPNSLSNTVDVISQRTLKIVAAFPGRRAAPARDAVLRPEDAVRRQRPRQQPHPDRPAHRHVPGAPIPVEDPYNLYFTPDGRYAIVVAERLPRLDFRDPHTMRAGPLAARAAVPRRRPHGLLRRRALRVRELRVRRPDDRDRPRAPSR